MLTVSLALCALGAVLSWPGPLCRWRGAGRAPPRWRTIGHAARGAVARLVHSVRRRAVPGAGRHTSGGSVLVPALTSGGRLRRRSRGGRLPSRRWLRAAGRAADRGGSAGGPRRRDCSGGRDLPAVVAAAASSGDPVGPRSPRWRGTAPDLAFAQGLGGRRADGRAAGPTLTSAARDTARPRPGSGALPSWRPAPSDHAPAHRAAASRATGRWGSPAWTALGPPPVARSPSPGSYCCGWGRWAAWMIRRALRPPGVPDPTGSAAVSPILGALLAIASVLSWPDPRPPLGAAGRGVGPVRGR